MWKHVDDSITVASPGVPRPGKVTGIWREQHFRPGEMPAAPALLPALVQKYGLPQGGRARQNAWIRLDWIRDPSGAPLAVHRRGYGVRRDIRPRAHGPSCNAARGLPLSAMVLVDPQNPALVKELSIGMLRQQALHDLGISLPAELRAMDGKCRQQEVETAKGFGANVVL
jgi:hypothetical protein